METAENLSVDIPKLARRKPEARSRVGNGKTLLPMVDGRSATARRFKDLVEDIAADLGGNDHLSEGQRQLIRRAAMLSAESERMEALAARGEAEFDIDLYGMICDRLGRVFGRLGLERVARPVNDGSQDLALYFAKPPPREAP
jgi:hypothetical protein